MVVLGTEIQSVCLYKTRWGANLPYAERPIHSRQYPFTSASTCAILLWQAQSMPLACLHSASLVICPARKEAELVAAGEVEDLPF